MMIILSRFIVLYSYHAQDENDLSVERGQCVTVLNKVNMLKNTMIVVGLKHSSWFWFQNINFSVLQDDPEWFWVVRADAQEGFVPAGSLLKTFPTASATNIMFSLGFVYPLDAIQQNNRHRKCLYYTYNIYPIRKMISVLNIFQYLPLNIHLSIFIS